MHSASVLIFCLYIPLFAAVAGKEQYLPVLRYLGEIVERIAHARIVKVDERVIEHDRAGILSAEEHVAQREPQRQIQLIGCAPAEEGALMEHRFPGAADKRIQLAVERELRIRSAGQPGEHRRGAFCQRRGKLRAHLLIGKRQLVERGGQCLQLKFHTFVFRFQLTQAGFPDQRIAERIEPSAQAGRLLTEKLLLLFVFRHPAERRGIAAEERREFLMEPQLLFGKAPGVFALFLRRTGEGVGYGVILPNSLTMLLPSALGFSPHPPVSVYGTGTHYTIAAFLGTWLTRFTTLFRSTSRLRIIQRICLSYTYPACTGLSIPGSCFPHASLQF